MDIVWIGGLAVLWIVVAELVVGLNRLDRQARPSGERPWSRSKPSTASAACLPCCCSRISSSRSSAPRSS